MFRRFCSTILIVALLLLTTSVILAQDEATAAPTAIATIEPTIDVSPDEPSVSIPDDAIILTGGQLLLYLGLAIFAGGGILAIFYRFLDNREVRDRVEKLYESASPEQQEALHRVIAGYEETNRRILDFAKAVTDGLPNSPQVIQQKE